MKKRIEGWREVLRIAWPLIVANSFWNLQVTIDRVFLGNFSTEALAASMSAAGIFWAPMALVQQTPAYLSTFVAQYFGAQREKEIGAAVWQALYVALAGGLLFLLFVPVTGKMFALIGHSDALQPLEADYFRALCYSALPTALVGAISGFFTGLGRSQVIMWINGIGLILNVVFDYLLIFGNFGFPALGIAGAGYATTIANWGAAFFGFYLIMTKEHQVKYRLLSAWRYNGELMKRFIKYGLPSGLQWALEGMAFTVFLIFVGQMPNGDAALAASSITVTVLMLAILPALGAAQGVSVLVGQHLGENRPERAESSAWSGLQVALIYIFAVGMTFVLFPDFYLSWFHNPANQELWEQTRVIVPYLLMFVAAFTLFDSSNLVFSFALRGAGDTRFVTLLALTLPWPIMVFPTYLVKADPHGVYWAWGAASIFIMIQAIVFWRRFTGGKWKSMRVI